MYYVFLDICIYIYIIQKNTCGLQRCLVRVTFGKSFQASSKSFDIVLSPHTVFCTMILYDTYIYFTHICTFSYTIMFSTSRCSKLGTFIVYSVCSLNMLYTHSSHFYPFQVRCHYRSCSSVLWWNSQSSSRLQVVFLLAYPLDRIYKPSCFICNIIWFCDDTYVLPILRVFDTN